MRDAVLTISLLAITIGQAYGQTKTGTVIIYRQWGARVGFLHYAQGEHPTISCDFTNIAKMAEGRKITVSAVAGMHTCAATEKQYPGTLNADSDTVSADVKPNGIVYLRLSSHLGHVHFALEEVPAETGSSETRKMKPVSDKDSYTTALMTNSERNSK